jgi:CBS domain containing-hemolysin-like protein
LAPKSLAIQRSEKTTLFIAYPLQFFFIIFRPFIWILNGIANFILRGIGITTVHGSDVHSSEELKYLVDEGQKSGKFDEAEYKLIKNAFEFSEQTAKQVMVPRTKVFAIDINDFDNEMIDEIIQKSHSRIPCYDNSLDNVIGVVSVKDILIAARKNEKFSIRDIISDMHVVPETKRIGPLLNEFQIKRQQMALVVNEYGGTEGIITMEDILEELVGEIQDESDNEIPFVQKTGEYSYNVLATAALDDINEYLPVPIKKDKLYETLAGYLILHFGGIPAVMEKMVFGPYEFMILKKNRSSIILVQILFLANKEITE